MVKHTGVQRRRYIRLDSVFPVDFRLVGRDYKTFLSDWLQGFTSNISRGGICLSVNNLKPEFVAAIQKGQARLLLNIHIPLSKHSTPAKCAPAWIETVKDHPEQYLIGLSYTEIPAGNNKRIVGYAWTRYLLPRFSMALLIILVLGVAVSGHINWRLTKQNRRLVSQLVRILQDSQAAQVAIDKINQEKVNLNARLEQVQSKIQDAIQQKMQLNRRIAQMQRAIKKRDKDERAVQQDAQLLALLLQRLQEEKDSLQQKLSNLQVKQSQASKELLVLDKQKAVLRQASFDNMYQWLRRHQNPRTGLIQSFEGDPEVNNWAFTYDQALIANAYIYFADFQNAEKIFDFFKYQAKKMKGAFLNAYYANDGQPAEYIVHSGPNIWLGIAIVQYTQKSQDTSYLDLAKEIANWVMQIQKEDEDGGIRGGPQVKWYSSEHNLDAYAFLTMLYQVTGKRQYQQSAEKILSWLLKHTYDQQDIPVRRGKGDSTIATDTYAWSIAALGPAKLKEIGLQPDDIIKFAEEHCCVEVSFHRPDGRVIRVKGFDFAAQRNLARGGVISCEWTAQMILSFKILANFYRKQQMQEVAATYQAKADNYLWQLSQMIISSPSPSGQGRGCLPYASSELVDTGHGWMTPQGDSTGSVAATAYALLAYYDYNPLQLSGTALSQK